MSSVWSRLVEQASATGPGRGTDPAARLAIGVDIGGSGVKAAVVDTFTGALQGERRIVDTPSPSTPDALARAVAELLEGWDTRTPLGVTFPGVIKNDIARSAANVDSSWVGIDARAVFTEAVGQDAYVLNDADAAGFAEASLGAAAGHQGVVLVITFGTGIGSGLVCDGALVPNLEIGHLELDGTDAEKRAAASVKSRENLDYPAWSERVQRYLTYVEMLFSPDLFVLGGGISADAEQWMPKLRLQAPVVAAKLGNDAGIVGAALAASRGTGSASRPTTGATTRP